MFHTNMDQNKIFPTTFTAHLQYQFSLRCTEQFQRWNMQMAKHNIPIILCISFKEKIFPTTFTAHLQYQFSLRCTEQFQRWNMQMAKHYIPIILCISFKENTIRVNILKTK
jgi:hypothetical protein